MAPRSVTVTQTETLDAQKKTLDRDVKRPERQIVWINVYFMVVLHLMALYGIYLIPGTGPRTWFWTWLCHFIGGLGITVGVHRLWSHRSYKASWPLRLALMLMNSLAAQNDIFEWARDHRVHHKYSETDADPHNAKRGFFFSHVGWLLVKKHPDVIKKGKQLDLSDLYEDKIVMFQRRHYKLLSTICNVIIPIAVPWYFWNESIWNGFFICYAFRYTFTLNATWCVNSFAHLWGAKPYDEHINPSQNFSVVIATGGEGFHNFHHTFPQDYATSELGSPMNPSKWFIDLCALFGLAYDLKTISKEAIRKRRIRTGDLQHLKHRDD
ncbi:stearoyl-CoA desaturase 5-like [Orbicella faveolata]|uniref:stearoyl-CoA desaturase 5-like n=1 Tax=Orbicella faveolata TaxID=48498 RepID=UPI0009E377D4|nr:stearoyl-CoA desaturase 5-like [Orbicella faveolata]